MQASLQYAKGIRMNKIAFVFPGQGAQYIGMGKDFYEQYESSKEIFDLASKVTGLDIPALCFEENDKLNITEYTQVCMLAVSAAILKVLEDKGLRSCVNAGLSLGEYGALAASKVLSLEDAFKVVRQRGIFMQEAVPSGGAMAAVIGMDGDKIAEICEQTDGIVSVANYNCPGQIAITGEASAVQKACDALKEAGARRIVPLNVSGPFHSAMLTEAGSRLSKVLDEVEIQDVTTPYVSNVTAQYVSDKSQVKELLQKQIYSSVRWQQSVENMIAQGVDTFIEIGPGKTLSGFLRKINRNMTALNVEKTEDIEKVLSALSM